MHLLHDGEVRLINVELACRIGEAEAQFICQLHYWLKMTKHYRPAPKDKEAAPYPWVYNTVDDWLVQWPYWSKSKMERTIKSCEEQDIIWNGQFNKLKQDRTKWYTINYRHDCFSENAADHPVNVTVSSIPHFDEFQSVILGGSNHKTTHENTEKITDISPKVKTVEQIATEQNLGTPEKPSDFEFNEAQVLDDLMEHREHGTVISVWWRKCMRGYGHVNHALPELTQKDQKQLKTLIKQLGATGPLRIMLALRFWPEYKKYADAEFGLKSTVKPVIQKFVLGRNAIAGFEAPKQVDYEEKEWKSL